MGYTHYFHGGDQRGFEAALPTIRKILKKYGNIICFECDKTNKKPVVNKKMIRFNGIGEEGHETFVFETGKEFEFCKTARKPYDLPVCEVLLVLKAYMTDLDLSSDGFSGYLSEKKIDGCWAEAVENVKEYGIDFNVVVTEERDPYCDFNVILDADMKPSTTIKLPCFGIVVKTENGAGSITSDLKNENPRSLGGVEERHNNMMDGIESMILAHAVAGIDIMDTAYIEGIETAVEACGNAAY